MFIVVIYLCYFLLFILCFNPNGGVGVCPPQKKYIYTHAWNKPSSGLEYYGWNFTSRFTYPIYNPRQLWKFFRPGSNCGRGSQQGVWCILALFQGQIRSEFGPETKPKMHGTLFQCGMRLPWRCVNWLHCEAVTVSCHANWMWANPHRIYIDVNPA